ncbi:hypothetical protein AAFF_G00175390 [Aldrovandia affinis]|uniref:Uncharacterized protein n=1 Tax=Aldrovandia affinis TaxID=143900 RepID=A0AAD7W801_9TELE|nr:hypothetical protein AAFF_G00175390 [Aldrovandia affinis]
MQSQNAVGVAGVNTERKSIHAHLGHCTTVPQLKRVDEQVTSYSRRHRQKTARAGEDRSQVITDDGNRAPGGDLHGLNEGQRKTNDGAEARARRKRSAYAHPRAASPSQQSNYEPLSRVYQFAAKQNK